MLLELYIYILYIPSSKLLRHIWDHFWVKQSINWRSFHGKCKYNHFWTRECCMGSITGEASQLREHLQVSLDQARFIHPHCGWCVIIHKVTICSFTVSCNTSSVHVLFHPCHFFIIPDCRCSQLSNWVIFLGPGVITHLRNHSQASSS